MEKSRVLVVDGIFLGAVVHVPGEDGWRVVAADDRIRDIHGRIVHGIAEAERLARQTLLSARPRTVAA